jgi:hypothetical protein
MSDYKAKQRKQEKAIQSSKKGAVVWSSTGGQEMRYKGGQGTYYKGANQIKKANKGMKAKLMRLMEKMR